MEVDSINEMFASSIEKFRVKYVNYIGDGDSKTFSSIVKNNPYGDESPVVKSECVGHVQKRMGTRLRKIKKKEKLGGKGRLTDMLIKKLTIYYGLAIRRNVHSVRDMKKAIMATLYHFISTDKNPKHESCPAGAESWCEWQRAKAMRKLATFTHPPCVIRPDVEKHILPIYEDLSKDDLLVRCMGGHTQNANESFNATVWRIAPKHLNSGPKVVQIAAFIAAGIFNEGYTAVLTLMRLLDLKIGQQCKIFADKTDESRIERAEQRHSDCTKKARIARRAEKTQQNELLEKAEGCLYSPGVAD